MVTDLHDGWTPQPQVEQQERGVEYNEAQRMAIGCEAAVTVVTAGPGSGKSHTIIGRILHGPAAPEQTIVVTYTTSAARILKERLAKHGAKVAFAGTVHAFLFRLIRLHHQLLGYGQRIAILDAEAAESLLLRVAKLHSFPGTMLELLEEKKSGPKPNPRSKAELVLSGYWNAMKQSNLIDFDTIIREGLRLIPMIDAWRPVSLCWDEFQDASADYMKVFNAIPCQYKMAVGDAKQSIFSFLGAEVANVMALMASGAVVIPLNDNYRCPTAVCELANRLIALNPSNDPTVSATGDPGNVELFDAGDNQKEGVIMARKINSLLAEHSDWTFAVLVMTHEHRRQVEDFLEGHGCPVERREEAKPPRDWRQVTALLNALADPDNQMLCETLVRAWKPLEADAIINAAIMSLTSLNDAALHLPYVETAKEALDYIEAKQPSVESSKRLRDSYERIVTDSGEASINDLQLALSERQDEKSVVQAGKVQVMTYWASKGSEFDCVLLPGLEEGMLPSAANTKTPELLAEARRILYVGVTRARHHLYLSWAGSRRNLWSNRLEERTRSRFLSEMQLT